MRERPELPEDVSVNPRQPELAGPAPLLQWTGMFLAPAAFLLHLQANYLLVLYVCGTPQGRGLIHLAAGVALLIALAGMFAAWSTWVRAGREAPGNAGGPFARSRMLGAVGLGASAIACLVLVAQLLATFLSPTCE